MSHKSDDLEYLQGAVSSLESYLLSKELYYPLGGPFNSGMVSSRLSLGALLLTLARLQADPGSSTNLLSVQEQVNELRSRWRVHWENKAAKEFAARLTLWQNALSELGGTAGADQAVYPVEVRNRVILELLRREAGTLPENEISRLAGLDHRLRARFIPGDFVWDADWIPAFPQDTFWYLYGTIGG